MTNFCHKKVKNYRNGQNQLEINEIRQKIELKII